MPINIVSPNLSGRPFRLTSERSMLASSDAEGRGQHRLPFRDSLRRSAQNPMA
jgi:hypothetical protein